MNELDLSPYLRPGDLYVSCTGAVLRTTVGSCISVCLYDSEKRIGGMNHFMYAVSSKEGSDDQYGDIAIPNLIKKMIDMGASLRNLKASLVGGASSFSSANNVSAGQKNINIAEEILSEKGIPIVFSEVGGCYGRKVQYITDSNELKFTMLEDCMGHCKREGDSCRFRTMGH